ncbi:MAG: hypothetical protein RLZ23_1271 [Actinomycetota bacterium]
MVLPIALADGDVIGQAKTGTGKTLAFGIPVIERVIAPKDPEWAMLESAGQPQALIVVPTRELCVQVTKDIEELSHSRGIRTLAVYGGRAKRLNLELRLWLAHQVASLISTAKARSNSITFIALYSMRQMRCSILVSYLMLRRSSHQHLHVNRRCSSQQRCRATSSLSLVAL